MVWSVVNVCGPSARLWWTPATLSAARAWRRRRLAEQCCAISTNPRCEGGRPGWHGRVGAGAGESALTLIVFAVLVHITTGPGFGGAVTGAMQTAGGISAEIVSLSADTDRGGEVSDKLSGALMAGFVRDPYDTISWGQLLEDADCTAARNQALATGPHGFDDAPRQLMEAAGCQAQAGFNADATVGRLVGALLYLVVAAAALALFVITAFTLVVAKGLALFLIALLPIALYAGLFPGAGRSLLWHWVAALTRVVALVIVMGIFLALLVTFFAIFTPILKIIGVAMIQFGLMRRKVLPAMEILGKLAMADIFLIALYIVVVKGVHLAKLQTGWGLYLVTFCVLASIFLTHATKKRGAAR